jgi:hypothetical protein
MESISLSPMPERCISGKKLVRIGVKRCEQQGRSVLSQGVDSAGPNYAGDTILQQMHVIGMAWSEASHGEAPGLNHFANREIREVFAFKPVWPSLFLFPLFPFAGKYANMLTL